MALASFTERRQRLRALLARPEASSPGSVFDAAFGRLAQHAGYECGLMGGSIASAAVLGTPDIMLLSLGELVDQVRRLTRACDLPLIVDGDHGYGNALSVARTVAEIEAAGVAALSIEDTLLPQRYGTTRTEVISREEFRDKLRAALDARLDPAFVIVGRVEALSTDGLDECCERVRICEQAGVDVIFVRGVSSIEQVQTVHALTSRPLMVNAPNLPAGQLAANGVRLIAQGHLPYFAALRALYEAQLHLRNGGSQAALKDRVLTPELEAIALQTPEYDRQAREYLGAGE